MKMDVGTIIYLHIYLFDNTNLQNYWTDSNTFTKFGTART